MLPPALCCLRPLRALFLPAGGLLPAARHAGVQQHRRAPLLPAACLPAGASLRRCHAPARLPAPHPLNRPLPAGHQALVAVPGLQAPLHDGGAQVSGRPLRQVRLQPRSGRMHAACCLLRAPAYLAMPCAPGFAAGPAAGTCIAVAAQLPPAHTHCGCRPCPALCFPAAGATSRALSLSLSACSARLGSTSCRGSRARWRAATSWRRGALSRSGPTAGELWRTAGGGKAGRCLGLFLRAALSNTVMLFKKLSSIESTRPYPYILGTWGAGCPPCPPASRSPRVAGAAAACRACLRACAGLSWPLWCQAFYDGGCSAATACVSYG